jgi:DNA gyrase/topoisomerase IV subunit B
MYTDTTRPNHLAHEVVDNSVDEALGGHAKEINVTLHKDNSCPWRTMAVACRWTSIPRRR